jgi:hypothetical protein
MIDPQLRDDAAPEATDRTVRQFALLCGVVLGLAAVRQGGGRGAAGWGTTLAVGAFAIALGGLLWPRLIRPLFMLALAITLPIGAVVSRVLLVIIYYVVFTPLALVFRVMGRDALRRRRPTGAQSYWTAKDATTDLRSYFRQS